MDAPSTDAPHPAYSSPPPVLVAAATEAMYVRAARTIEAAGLRASVRIDLDQACERIDRQAVASALWLELGSARGRKVEDLLDRLNCDVAGGRYAAVISAPAEAIDAITARVSEPTVEIL